MLERVARAIYEKATERASILVGFGFDSPSWEELGEPDRTSAIGEARAAIEAMRMPTESMRRAMNNAGIPPEVHKAFMRELIDAALK